MNHYVLFASMAFADLGGFKPSWIARGIHAGELWSYLFFISRNTFWWFECSLVLEVVE